MMGALLGASLWLGCERPSGRPQETSASGRRPGQAAQSIEAKPQWPKNAVRGDFDGDGVPEYVWLVPPVVVLEEMECKGDCTSNLRFSNARLPAIPMVNCIGGKPTNLGDLNGDGADEIGLLPEWFSSCWSSYHVFTYRTAAWTHLVQPFSTHCNQWEAKVKPIEKDPSQPGHVLVHYSESTDKAIVVRTKSIAIK